MTVRNRHVRKGETPAQARKRNQARTKKTQYLKSIGQGVRVDPAPAVAHIKALHDKGMSFQQMVDQSGLGKTTLQDLARGRRSDSAGGKPLGEMDRRVIEVALMIRYIPEGGYGSLVDPVGVRRRLRALFYDGFSGPFLADRLGWTVQRVHLVTNGKSDEHHHSTVGLVRGVYENLQGVDPRSVGVNANARSRARNLAADRDWAPSYCWDDDTIDDPAAIPEWTGQCGTVFGWRIHELKNIPACQPCTDAQDSDSGVLSGDRLRALRARRGLSQDQLAKAAGIKVDQYRSWECNRTKPRFQSQIESILTVLDVTYDQVCE